MTPLNELEREAMEEWWHETEQIGFARAVWPAIAFWIAIALFVCAAWPANAQGYRVPPFYGGCKVPASVKILHVDTAKVNSVCKTLGVVAGYNMGACFTGDFIILPHPHQVSRAWYDEFFRHEIAHANGWRSYHPRLKNLDKVRACK